MGAWYVLRKEDDSVLGDIGFKGNQTRIKQ